MLTDLDPLNCSSATLMVTTELLYKLQNIPRPSTANLSHRSTDPPDMSSHCSWGMAQGSHQHCYSDHHTAPSQAPGFPLIPVGCQASKGNGNLPQPPPPPSLQSAQLHEDFGHHSPIAVLRTRGQPCYCSDGAHPPCAKSASALSSK